MSAAATAMTRRARAAQATLDEFRGKRVLGKPFKPGRRECGQMLKFHLVAMGRPLKFAARIGTYNSIAGGVRALKRQGYDGLTAVMDAHFERIAPAKALVGDVIQLESEDDRIGGMAVAMGNGRVLGYHQSAAGATVLQPSEYLAAWRVEPGS